MPSLVDRIKAFARSPQGRKLTDQAQREIQKPENQRKLRQLAAKLQGRGKRPH